MADQMKVIDQLIITSPYEEPKVHWSYDVSSQTFEMKNGRRPAGYTIASKRARTHNDPGIFVDVPLVNQIRPRVKQWKANGYPGVTGVTKKLLDHWNDAEYFEQRRFFFCQMEAIETLIWFIEAPASEKVGIEVPSDGGEFQRLCSKMATGTGKTIVMSMAIAWQILNKITYPKDARFSKSVLVIAPGLTVRSRLSVLNPSAENNYFEKFQIVPNSLISQLRQGRVQIQNWHALTWATEDQIAKRRSVDKRGPLSDEAYIRNVLGDLSSAKNILVINDEAHHAWRVPAESKIKGVRKEDIDEATRWVSALDRINKTRGLLYCLDFSATPFAPSGKAAAEETLFDWIISDFGINDAVESGLIKTPRVVVRDNGKIDPKTYKSLLYHLYEHEEVKEDLNRSVPEETPLPSIVINAYTLLGHDWLETKNVWDESRVGVPPVMISVVNRTETAARIKYSFDRNKIKIKELCDPDKTIHIDSAVLKDAESQNTSMPTDIIESGMDENATKLTKKQQAELLRLTVDTVGVKGEPGEQVQNVISVGMLSEGWDARTVTHIMGLRAFSSQLLCEQVVGRGLRRTSYEVDPETGLFSPEYVNVFGIPFSFLPFEGDGSSRPKPSGPKIPIFPDPEKNEYRIEWPNIVRVDRVYRPELQIDIDRTPPIILNASEIVEIATLAPTIDGRPDLTKIKDIDLAKMSEGLRLQRVMFEATRDLHDQMSPSWKGNKASLLGQLVKITEGFLNSGLVKITPDAYGDSEEKRNLAIMLSMSKIVQHLIQHIQFQNTERLEAVFDSHHPIRSTDDAQTWHTGKPCAKMIRTHMNLSVFDSTWEKSVAEECDRNSDVLAWVKNDHLGFEIYYTYNGVIRRYIPDFILKLSNNRYLILEVKGIETERDRTKWGFLNEWVNATNNDGRFGKWKWDVSMDASGKDINKIISIALNS